MPWLRRLGKSPAVSPCGARSRLALPRPHCHALASAVRAQREGPQPEGKESRDRGGGQYLELVGLLNDDFELRVLPQDRAPHLRDSALFLLLAGQRLLFVVLLCKAKSPSVSRVRRVTLERASSQEAPEWEGERQSS